MAASAADSWQLMSRHGECAEVEILRRKFPDMGEIETPDEFIKYLQEQGFSVETQTLDPQGAAIEIKVAARDLGVIFVRSSLCEGMSKQARPDHTFTPARQR